MRTRLNTAIWGDPRSSIAPVLQITDGNLGIGFRRCEGTSLGRLTDIGMHQLLFRAFAIPPSELPSTRGSTKKALPFQ
jgi:hypothetical protein